MGGKNFKKKNVFIPHRLRVKAKIIYYKHNANMHDIVCIGEISMEKHIGMSLLCILRVSAMYLFKIGI